MKTDGIIGHKKQLGYLESMLESGFKPQALMFCGINGIGKRKIAKRFLMTLFCNDGSPCLTCKNCNTIEKDNHPDVIMLSPNEKGTIPMGDEGSAGTVRWLISRLSKKPHSGRYGVIIDGADSLSASAQNALLKILEEPPQNTLIIIITSGKKFILPTILSRVTEISFRELSREQVLFLLKEQGQKNPLLELAADICGGSVEMASLVLQNDNLEAVENIISSIAFFIRDKGILNLELDLLQKKIGAEALLFILVNSFRAMLLAKINGATDHGFFSKYAFLDENVLAKLIKIILSLSHHLDLNLLLGNSLKGMLYSIDTMRPVGLPIVN